MDALSLGVVGLIAGALPPAIARQSEPLVIGVQTEPARRLRYQEHQLRRAIAHDDAARVRHLVAEGASPTASEEGSVTPLAAAIATNNRAMVELLLSLGAGANISEQEWKQTLHTACMKERSDASILRAVLSLRPNQSAEGLALVAADGAMFGREPVLRMALEMGADPFASRDWAQGLEPEPVRLLALARRLSWHPVATPGASWRPLLAAYAEAALRAHPAATELGITRVMALASLGNNAEISAALKEHPESAGGADTDGWTPLHWAAGGRADMAMVQELLDAGGLPDALSKSGDTPLMVAAASGNAAAIRALLRAGASVLPPGFERGVFPLAIACRFGHRDAAGELIAATGGLGGEMKTIALSIAAFEAVEYEHWPLVLTLIEAGLDPNAKDGRLREVSLLAAVAATSGGGEVINALFDAGNNEPPEGATSGWWAMDRAIRVGNAEVFKRLLARIQERGEKATYGTGHRMIDEALCRAAASRRTEFIRELIAAGADVNASGINGSTALYYASGPGFSDAVRLLLEHGADPTGAGEQGNLPLTAAASTGTGEVIELLLASGAQIDAADPRGYTPLQTAAMFANVEAIKVLMRAGAAPAPYGHTRTPIVCLAFGERPWSSEAIRALVEGGADVNEAAIGGTTPLDVAEAIGHAQIIGTLIELGARRGKDLRDLQ